MLRINSNSWFFLTITAIGFVTNNSLLTNFQLLFIKIQNFQSLVKVLTYKFIEGQTSGHVRVRWVTGIREKGPKDTK